MDELESFLEALVDKGWIPYEARDNENVRQMKPRGPAQSLEVGANYILFTKVDSPRDYHSVMSAISRLVSQHITPVARLGKNDKEGIALAYFTTRKEGIIAHSMIDIFISYSDLPRIAQALTPAGNY